MATIESNTSPVSEQGDEPSLTQKQYGDFRRTTNFILLHFNLTI